MAHVPAERCLGIIELLADGAREMPLGDIAERLVLPKSGAHRLLATLVDLGWAEQDRETGFYRLTMRLAVLGQRFYVASGLPDICQPVLDRFAHDCREFARLAVVGVTAIAAAIRSGTDGATVGTVSIAGPTVRMTESRVRELAPLVTQCATELSNLWPVRPKAVSHDGRSVARDVGKAA